MISWMEFLEITEYFVLEGPTGIIKSNPYQPLKEWPIQGLNYGLGIVSTML